MPVKVGSCWGANGHYKRYYYNRQKKTCLSFNYSGCDGNQNNFQNYWSCISYCRKSTHEFQLNLGLCQSNGFNMHPKAYDMELTLKKNIFLVTSFTMHNTDMNETQS